MNPSFKSRTTKTTWLDVLQCAALAAGRHRRFMALGVPCAWFMKSRYLALSEQVCDVYMKYWADVRF